MSEQPDIPTITVHELAEKLGTEPEGFVLIDVREPHEHDVCRIEGAKLIPLGEIGQHMDALDRSAAYVVHCKLGGRSAKAVQALLAAGFQRVHNVEGGIDAWARHVDPSMPRY